MIKHVRAYPCHLMLGEVDKVNKAILSMENTEAADPNLDMSIKGIVILSEVIVKVTMTLGLGERKVKKEATGVAMNLEVLGVITATLV